MNFPFVRRSVASITASLGRMVEELKAHAEAKLAEVDKHNAHVERLTALIDGATEEADKARAAAEKIGNLFSN